MNTGKYYTSGSTDLSDWISCLGHVVQHVVYVWLRYMLFEARIRTRLVQRYWSTLGADLELRTGGRCDT